MKALIQRISGAKVVVGGKTVCASGRGLLVFLGVEKGDTVDAAGRLCRKVASLRIFEDKEGKMNLSLRDTGGEALVVSQFTLAANLRKGHRPSFENAEAPERARELYGAFIECLRGEGVRVSEGVFQARMEVHLVNDGPVTIMLDVGSA